jgi:hypothetical protein
MTRTIASRSRSQHDDEMRAWAIERERLQQQVIDAARALLAHQGHAGFRVPLGDGRVAMAGDAHDLASLAAWGVPS